MIIGKQINKFITRKSYAITKQDNLNTAIRENPNINKFVTKNEKYDFAHLENQMSVTNENSILQQ